MSNHSPVHEIVSPEPHSRGLRGFEEAWKRMPRWLQITLLGFVVGGILAAIFIKLSLW
jgi:hypothetical protein